MMKDFNLPVARGGNTDKFHTRRDLDMNFLDSDLHQQVNKPTRDNSILDLILTATENLINEVNVCPVFSSSDH